MKIQGVTANNRTKAFEVATSQQSYSFPYAMLRVRPEPKNGVAFPIVIERVFSKSSSWTITAGRGFPP